MGSENGLETKTVPDDEQPCGKEMFTIEANSSKDLRMREGDGDEERPGRRTAFYDESEDQSITF